MNWKTTLALLLPGTALLLFWKGPEVLSSKPAGRRERVAQARPRVLAEEPRRGRGLVKRQAAGEIPGPGVRPAAGVGRELARPQGRTRRVDDAAHQVRARFAPVPLTDKSDLKSYGLTESSDPVSVQVKINDRTYNLLFGQPEPAQGENPFTQPTYLRIDERNELLRLGPDVMQVLRRTEQDYRLRQTFPEKARLRMTRSLQNSLARRGRASRRLNSSTTATKMRVDGPAGTYVLERVAEPPAEKPLASRPTGDRFVTPAQIAESWRLVEPVADHIDPAKLKSILSAITELWGGKVPRTGRGRPPRLPARRRRRAAHPRPAGRFGVGPLRGRGAGEGGRVAEHHRRLQGRLVAAAENRQGEPKRAEGRAAAATARHTAPAAARDLGRVASPTGRQLRSPSR